MKHSGWTSRGYLPHCDAAQLIQHLTFATAGKGEGIAGHFGARLFAEAEAASAVQDALLHFDGERYCLLAWCVMPNHVHVVAEQAEGWPLAKVMHGWKSFTANKVNRLLGRRGSVWLREYYDRFMRDDDHLAKTIAYVERNPVAAGYAKRETDWLWSSASMRAKAS